MAETKVRSEVAGSVWKVQVKPGDQIAEGDELFILESMKMEIPVSAERAGTVKTVLVKEGEQVAEDQVLATLEG